MEQFEVVPLNLINTLFVNFSTTNFFIINIFILLGVTGLMLCNNTLKLNNTFCSFSTRRKANNHRQFIKKQRKIFPNHNNVIYIYSFR